MAKQEKNASGSSALTRQHYQMATGTGDVARKNSVPAPSGFSKGAKVAPKRGS
jgi:hypothetical protein